MTDKNKVSDAQVKASRKWEKNNPEVFRYQNAKRMARTFARKHAKPGDLEELRQIYINENPNAKKKKNSKKH